MKFEIPVQYNSSSDSYYITLSPAQMITLGISPNQSLAIESHTGVDTLTVRPFDTVKEYLIKQETLVTCTYLVSATDPTAAIEYITSNNHPHETHEVKVLSTTICDSDTPPVPAESSLDGLKLNPYINPSLY
jgi:DNA-binding transcriptional regulator YdaS (Cro superfamily)